MTIINQKSISGITSVTFASAGDDLLTFHSNNGTERFRIDNSGNTKITAGIVTTLTVTGNATVGGTLGVTGETTFSTHVNLGDSDRLRLGADNDLQIFHDGSNSYISDQGTGQLQLISAGAAVEIKKNTGEAMGLFKTDGAVELYYDNSKKFETTSYGLQFTDNVKFDNPDTAGRDLTWEADNDALHWEDNTKATFGGGNDLQIYHNGSHSYIADEGTGELNISGSRIQLLNAARSEKAIDFVQDGAVDIYHNGSKKFETTSGGITVSGNVTASGVLFGSDTADANTLNDYEEGSFVPNYGSGITSPSYTATGGHYTKIGQLVTFTIRIRATGTNSSAQIKIAGLPFSSNAHNEGSVSFGYTDNMNGNSGFTGHIPESSSEIHMYQFSGSNLNGNSGNGISGRTLHLRGFYYTNS